MDRDDQERSIDVYDESLLRTEGTPERAARMRAALERYRLARASLRGGSGGGDGPIEPIQPINKIGPS